MAALLVSLTPVQEGAAQTAPQTSFQVAATISEGCLVDSEIPGDGASLGSLGSLDFGTASSLSQQTRTSMLVDTAGVTLSCTPGIALIMRIDGGLHASGGVRHMESDAGAGLAYALFADASYQQAIGIDASIAVDTLSDPNNISLPIYGRLTLPGARPSGVYTDRLAVTLEW
ncbi:spore coat U domain-containing protein [Halomonas elongata]|uniref:Csu type fimbrial protein n=1 Tax=Halomonas elongata TaxID=2746 RepID=UPI00255AD823|nr:spore coat U domain-containing protein [Halomonas elongata]MDL4861652.1 spore coat U domain-containing protein [Halomonas elongata]